MAELINLMKKLFLKKLMNYGRLQIIVSVRTVGWILQPML